MVELCKSVFILIFILISTQQLFAESNWNLDFYKSREIYKQLVGAMSAIGNGEYPPERNPQILGSSCTYPSDKFSNMASYSIDLLDRLYCHQQIGKSSEELLKPYNDVPAEISRFWTPEYILDRMKYASSRFQDQQLVDFQTLYELNLESVRVWDDLLACSNGDAERARELYRTAQFPGCKKVEQSVRDLHTHMVQFLKSTNVAPVMRPIFEGFSGLPPDQRIEAHPLLLQVFDDILAAWFVHSNRVGPIRSWMRDLLENGEINYLSKNLLNLLPILPLTPSAPRGLWPTATKCVYAYDLALLKDIDSEFMAFVSPTQVALSGIPSGPLLGAIVLLNPMTYVIRAFAFAADEMNDLYEVDVMSFEISAHSGVSLHIYDSNAENLANQFREMSKRYGVTNTSLK